ncbi:antitoxin HicB [Candidatus Roizmanbacteria bacterium CG22_combo_CG10-13_8_21_14_all_35_9]|uniref:Antitoxin HicB n=3 Tax=Candidatus Roizmaniibacteriota TaxID=1752723 RepID=A0A2M8F2C0_9BACT|nr:MAG: antitoxin HicB [Candidatus Roizmanbacteria bacterium CG23_combo_of_CG06-09_8_20_14_all_35_49]PIP62799.1 MAG: antitoxin HicB [Candidatus Roizmanbacteria bacterium CG22_combo_CG10-13_8_21_14_all_35_9]PJC33435.1 MAG: antitoxin HicB [Candidatus Roizmanbacteria bacterium CG_4_9_14_0_2_um_filter_35_15]PJC82817.1 MAG: antitoxin HicB [Candidatus Roizmanbacteria bacterium CG_4_8_14_3_um_filter_35_14]
MKQKVLNYTAVFQKEPEGGYTVFVPMLPGCVSYGKNLEEAKKMINEAIELYIESLSIHNEEIPTEENIFYSQININPSKLNISYV